MNKKTLIIISLMLVIGSASLGVNPVVADSDNVTTTWIVPGDTTITVSYPANATLGKIQFDCPSETFSDLKATDQTAGNAILRVQNDGNTPLIINASWSSAWPSNVTHVNVSVGDNTNSTSLSYTSGNCQSNQTLKASLGIGSTEDFWFWSSGVDVEETSGSGVDRTLVIYSEST